MSFMALVSLVCLVHPSIQVGGLISSLSGLLQYRFDVPAWVAGTRESLQWSGLGCHCRHNVTLAEEGLMTKGSL